MPTVIDLTKTEAADAAMAEAASVAHGAALSASAAAKRALDSCPSPPKKKARTDGAGAGATPTDLEASRREAFRVHVEALVKSYFTWGYSTLGYKPSPDPDMGFQREVTLEETHFCTTPKDDDLEELMADNFGDGLEDLAASIASFFGDDAEIPEYETLFGSCTVNIYISLTLANNQVTVTDARVPVVDVAQWHAICALVET